MCRPSAAADYEHTINNRFGHKRPHVLGSNLVCERTEERRYAGECSGPVSTGRGLGSLNRNNDRKAIKSAATMAGNSAGKFGEFCAALLATGCGRRSRSDCGSQDGGDRVEPGEGRKKQRERSDPALLKRQAAERVTRARTTAGSFQEPKKPMGTGLYPGDHRGSSGLPESHSGQPGLGESRASSAPEAALAYPFC